MEVEKKMVVAKELRKQMVLAGPLIMASILQYILQVVSIMFVGHLGDLSLSAASLASSFANVFGFFFMMGISSALDTLCGQSFGAKQYKMVGIHMQRAMATILLASIPLSFLLAFSSPILVLLRQVPEISMAAQSYTRWMIPSLLPFGLLQCHFKFLQAQNIVFPILFSSGATALFHCLFCWVLVHKSGLGFRGAALSVSASSWVNLLQIVIYVNFSSSCKATWAGFSREALHGLGEFLKLAVP